MRRGARRRAYCKPRGPAQQGETPPRPKTAVVEAQLKSRCGRRRSPSREARPRSVPPGPTTTLRSLAPWLAALEPPPGVSLPIAVDETASKASDCPYPKRRALSASSTTRWKRLRPASIGSRCASRSMPWSACCCSASSVSIAGCRNGSTHSRRSDATCAPQPSASPRSRTRLRTYVPDPHSTCSRSQPSPRSTRRNASTSTSRSGASTVWPRRAIA